MGVDTLFQIRNFFLGGGGNSLGGWGHLRFGIDWWGGVGGGRVVVNKWEGGRNVLPLKLVCN